MKSWLTISTISLAAALAVLLCAQPVPASASAEGSFQRTLSVTGPVNLDVSTGSGSIQIHTGSANQVEVTGHIKATDWFGSNGEEKVKRIEQNPPIQQSGNSIRIGHLDDPELQHNISISYEVIVPAQTELRAQPARATRPSKAFADPSKSIPDPAA